MSSVGPSTGISARQDRRTATPARAVVKASCLRRPRSGIECGYSMKKIISRSADFGDGIIVGTLLTHSDRLRAVGTEKRAVVPMHQRLDTSES